jgi:hypothetical protein
MIKRHDFAEKLERDDVKMEIKRNKYQAKYADKPAHETSNPMLTGGLVLLMHLFNFLLLIWAAWDILTALTENLYIRCAVIMVCALLIGGWEKLKGDKAEIYFQLTNMANDRDFEKNDRLFYAHKAGAVMKWLAVIILLDTVVAVSSWVYVAVKHAPQSEKPVENPMYQDNFVSAKKVYADAIKNGMSRKTIDETMANLKKSEEDWKAHKKTLLDKATISDSKQELANLMYGGIAFFASILIAVLLLGTWKYHEFEEYKVGKSLGLDLGKQ